MLKKYSSSLGLGDGVHASHDAYSRKIREFLDKKYKKYYDEFVEDQFQGSSKELEQVIANKLHNDIANLRKNLKDLLEKKSILGNPPTKVNDLANDTDFLNLLK